MHNARVESIYLLDEKLARNYLLSVEKKEKKKNQRDKTKEKEGKNTKKENYEYYGSLKISSW